MYLLYLHLDTVPIHIRKFIDILIHKTLLNMHIFEECELFWKLMRLHIQVRNFSYLYM